MATVFLVLFLIFSAIHLYDSWHDNAKNRARTKPFLLLFLVLYYVTSADKLAVFLLLALVTSWLGDILLIPEGHGWFTAGGISFLLSHIFFILAYTEHIRYTGTPWGIVIPVALLYYVVSVFIIHKVRPTTPKPMVVPMCLYLIANSTMNVFALIQFCTHRGGASLTALIGALLFFVSDCTLFLVRYYKKNSDLIFKKHFTVMLTYLAGEFLIVLGMLGM